MRPNVKVFWSVAVLWVLRPAVSEACAVCFGGVSSNMARGFFWGILLLLLLPFGLLGSLIGLVVYHARKNKSPIPNR